MDPESASNLKACPCCGLVQRVGVLAPGSRALCARCGVTVLSPSRPARSNARAFAAALAGLILYPLAISLPIMRLERFGHLQEASVWTGSVGLLAKGEVLVGSIVLLCSVLIPLGKLLGLLLITGRPSWLGRRHRARTYRWIEWTGRFGMLDVLLIAVVVAWIKFGDLLEVSAGPAALTFTLVVLLSLAASASFDPHALWQREDAAGAGAPAR
jgi:paraquat-inducible protein A